MRGPQHYFQRAVYLTWAWLRNHPLTVAGASMGAVLFMVLIVQTSDNTRDIGHVKTQIVQINSGSCPARNPDPAQCRALLNRLLRYATPAQRRALRRAQGGLSDSTKARSGSTPRSGAGGSTSAGSAASPPGSTSGPAPGPAPQSGLGFTGPVGPRGSPGPTGPAGPAGPRGSPAPEGSSPVPSSPSPSSPLPVPLPQLPGPLSPLTVPSPLPAPL